MAGSQHNYKLSIQAPSQICLEQVLATSGGGVACGEPNIQLSGFIAYSPIPWADFIPATTVIPAVAEPNFAGVAIHPTSGEWIYSDNGENGNGYLTQWPTFQPAEGMVLIADVIFANGPNGGSVFVGPLQAGSTNGIDHGENIGGFTSINGNQYTNGSTNTGEFYLEGSFSLPPITACLQLARSSDPLYIRDDNNEELSGSQAIVDGWKVYKPKIEHLETLSF